MRKMKQFVSLLLTSAMLLTSGASVNAFEPPSSAEEAIQSGFSSSENAYAIYPIPQNITYSENGEFQLDETVNVVSENGIDSYTNDFLSEILTDYSRTESKTESIPETGSKILLGIKGSGGAVDQWANNNLSLKDTDLFTKTDAYALSAKDGVIAILGKDTNAVYYGLSTLQMMFSSFAGQKFLNAQIEDYAVMKMRGFIEGFYGGWNYEGRESLMRSARDVKMNTYIYASKTDEYHKNDVPYPQEEIDKIKHLVDVGKETKVQYAWSVHISYFFGRLNGKTVGSDEYNKAFDENFEKLKAKFQQLYDIGVRKFAILNDDFGGGATLSEVVKLLNKVDDEFLTPNNCLNLTYCMEGYNKGWANAGYGQNGKEMEAMKGLNSSIDLFWTGDDVNSPITQETVDYVKEKTNHEAVFWLNYPVNEHGKSGVYLGNITHYARDNVTGLAGAVSNPCLFTEANKPGLFQLGSLFWNNHDYLENANQIWEDSFKYLQPEVYDAYLTIARNVANCPGSRRIPAGFPESEYIKDDLDAIGKKIQRGLSISKDEAAISLKKEFAHMLSSVKTFREKCNNEVLISDLDSWLKSLTDIATAGEAALQAIFQLESNKINAAWKNLAIASQAISTYNTYPSYGGSMALAASKYVTPFVKKAIAAAKNQLVPYLMPDATNYTPTFIGEIAKNDVSGSSECAKVLDGDKSTAALFKPIQVFDESHADWYGVDLGTTVEVHTIDILQGANDNDHDYFHRARLEYSEDFETWTSLGDYTDERHIRQENLTINARFIRLILTELGTPDKEDYWTYIREITINEGEQEEEPATYGLYSSNPSASGEVTLDAQTYTLSGAESQTLEPNGYIGIKLKEIKGISAVNNNVSSMDGLVLEYSQNEVIWNEAPDSFNGEAARYVRLRNASSQTVTFQLNAFEVVTDSASINMTIESNYETFKEGKLENLIDGNPDTNAWTGRSQKKGDYIIVDLGTVASVNNIDILSHELGQNPVINDMDIKVSTDKVNWDTEIEIRGSKGDYTERENIKTRTKKNLNGKNIRYLKLEVTSDYGYYMNIFEISIETVNTPGSSENENKTYQGTLTGEMEKMTDGDISTVYVSEKASDGNDYLKYNLSENTNFSYVTLLQDATNITNATVSAEVYDGTDITTKELGIFDRGAKTFPIGENLNVFSLTIHWPKDTTPVIYEIIPSDTLIIEPEADKTDLNTAIANAEALKEQQSDYTEATWNQLESKLKEAQLLADDPDASQNEVDLMKDALEGAINGLKKKPAASVVTELQDELKKAEEIINKGKGDYSDQVWNAFVTAYNKAKEAEKNGYEMDESSIKEILNALNEAKKEIEKEGSTNPEPTNKPIQSITFAAKTYQIAKKASFNLTKELKLLPEDATNQKLDWVSSKPKIATVINGSVKAKAVGKTTISAISTDGSNITGKVTIQVMKGAVSKITLKAAKTVRAGKSIKIKSTVKTKGGKANKKLSWKSSNEKFATVKNGKVTAKKAGKGKRVTITAFSTDGTNKKASVKIKIN